MDLLELYVIGGHFSGTTVGFVIFFYFTKRIYDRRDRIKELIPFIGISLVFFFLSVAYLFRLQYYFFLWEYNISSFSIILIFYGFLMGNTIAFFFIFEYIFKKTRFILTGYSIIALILILLSQNITRPSITVARTLAS